MTRRKTPFQTQYSLHGCVLESVPSAKYLGVTISEDLRCTNHIDSITKKASQTLGFLKRNIRVHNQNLKSTAYKTLVRPQLEYASSVWSPFTALDTYQLESVQRRAARWVTRDYRYTSSVSAMLQDLNWHPLDQRRIDSRLVLLYKVTYDLVVIPAGDYLIRNTRPSAKNRPLAYRQITTLKDYYKFTFFPGPSSTGTPYQPIYMSSQTWHSSVQLFARLSIHNLKRQYLFLSFNYTNTLDRTVQFHPVFFYFN